MNKFLSQKFKFFLFVSILLVVAIHGYNLNETYLQPFSVVNERISLTTFLEYWLANGIFRFVVPLLFLISGYLFSYGDSVSYGIRIKKKFKSLFLPYLIWSAIALLLTYCLQGNSLTKQSVIDAHLDQLGDNRSYDLLGWSNLLLRWTLFPIAFQLWFVRCLFVYNLASPLIMNALNNAPKIWFGVCAFLWIVTFGTPLFEAEGLLFFSLGIQIQKTGFNIESPDKYLKPKIWLVILLLSTFSKTMLAFYLNGGFESFVILSLLHKISVIAALIVVWFGGNNIVTFFMNKQWFYRISSYSFIIYVIHVPLINYFTRFIFIHLYHFSLFRLTAFVCIPIIMILFSLIFGIIFKKVTPKLYGIFTGGRGF